MVKLLAMKKSQLLVEYKDYLILRNYSARTIKTYLSSINSFLDFVLVKNDADSDVFKYAKSFLIQRFKDGKSWSSVNVDYSSLRILIVNVLGKEWDYEIMPRPKGKASIPTVLSGKQAESMINVTGNLKHKLILIILYTSGLRVSELIDLDISHILNDRLQLKVEKGKGGKGRVISLPKITIDAIEFYIQSYKPKKFLLEGMSQDHMPRCRYSVSSVRKIVVRAAFAVGIKWNVSAHSLRHAFATHHIENGTDLVTLQQQLGHNSISTTIKYVKFCKTKQRHIHHPIEKLNIKL